MDTRKLSLKWFKKWSIKARLTNDALLLAIRNLEATLSCASLGQHLYKVRIKRPYGGKSSGFRTIIVYNKGDRAIFLYGFAKNEKSNIDKGKLRHLRMVAHDLLAIPINMVEQLIHDGILFDLEVK